MKFTTQLLDFEMNKLCRWCGETKPLSLFHRHPRMKDGHLNKCAACVVKYVAKWNKEHPEAKKKAYRKTERHLNALKNGTVKLGLGRCKEKARIRSTKYIHKRRQRVEIPMTEWDEFVVQEALTLIQQRNKQGTTKWTLDHIVPLHHKLACGLHNGFNIQVVPDWWNFKKGNRNMDLFWT